MIKKKLILLYDGGCPLCQREISFLRSRDRLNSILFVDIDSPSYKADLFSGISYREAMGEVHAINANGEVVKGARVFLEAYRLIGLGWIYLPITWPLFGPCIDQFYKLWARWRLSLTRWPSIDQLCKLRDSNINSIEWWLPFLFIKIFLI